jgi:hypothetical protein
MTKAFGWKAALSVLALIMCLMASGNAQAQALYQPYYYVQREQYQAMTPRSTPPAPPSPSYPPDERLSQHTNQALAQGNPPPTPPQPKLVPIPSTLPLTTRAGLNIGVQGSHYEYNESIGVHETGYKIGFLGSGTATFGDKMFATVDFRYALGQVDYSSGSGKLGGVPDNLWEIRGIIGRDFTYRDLYDVSPYVGFGYRNLYDDLRGTTDLGAHGYQRTNNRMYIPLGVTPRVRIDGDSRLAMNIEYDFLIHGEQESDLSDAGFGDPNVLNQQSSGYGLRGELMWEQADWSIGPFLITGTSTIRKSNFSPPVPAIPI